MEDNLTIEMYATMSVVKHPKISNAFELEKSKQQWTENDLAIEKDYLKKQKLMKDISDTVEVGLLTKIKTRLFYCHLTGGLVILDFRLLPKSKKIGAEPTIIYNQILENASIVLNVSKEINLKIKHGLLKSEDLVAEEILKSILYFYIDSAFKLGILKHKWQDIRKLIHNLPLRILLDEFSLRRLFPSQNIVNTTTSINYFQRNSLRTIFNHVSNTEAFINKVNVEEFTKSKIIRPECLNIENEIMFYKSVNTENFLALLPNRILNTVLEIIDIHNENEKLEQEEMRREKTSECGKAPESTKLLEAETEIETKNSSAECDTIKSLLSKIKNSNKQALSKLKELEMQLIEESERINKLVKILEDIPLDD